MKFESADAARRAGARFEWESGSNRFPNRSRERESHEEPLLNGLRIVRMEGSAAKDKESVIEGETRDGICT